MKEQLIRAVDRAAIARAKAFARKEKTSVSELVERQFKLLGAASFADKWQGQFKVPPPTPDDPRLNDLLKKYVH